MTSPENVHLWSSDHFNYSKKVPSWTLLIVTLDVVLGTELMAANPIHPIQYPSSNPPADKQKMTKQNWTHVENSSFPMQAWSNGNFASTLRPSIRVFCLWRWARFVEGQAFYGKHVYKSSMVSICCMYKIFTYIYHVISQMQVNIPYMEHLGMYVYVADYSYYHEEAKPVLWYTLLVLFLVPMDCLGDQIVYAPKRSQRIKRTGSWKWCF